MNRKEHLLVILMEECNELAKDASKALRFGLDSNYDGVTNLTKLKHEYNDLMGVLDLLAEEGICIPLDDSLINAKKEKIEMFLKDSERIGTLSK